MVSVPAAIFRKSFPVFSFSYSFTFYIEIIMSLGIHFNRSFLKKGLYFFLLFSKL